MIERLYLRMCRLKRSEHVQASAEGAQENPKKNLSANVDKDLLEDVKEGHFVVHTIDHGVPKRSIIDLGCLAYPGFLKLLDQAEEFGSNKREFLPFPVGKMSSKLFLTA